MAKCSPESPARTGPGELARFARFWFSMVSYFRFRERLLNLHVLTVLSTEKTAVAKLGHRRTSALGIQIWGGIIQANNSNLHFLRLFEQLFRYLLLFSFSFFALTNFEKAYMTASPAFYSFSLTFIALVFASLSLFLVLSLFSVCLFWKRCQRCCFYTKRLLLSDGWRQQQLQRRACVCLAAEGRSHWKGQN